MCLSLFTLPIGIFFDILMALYHSKKSWYESSKSQLFLLEKVEDELLL